MKIYHVLGLMSGSSLDGLDLAFCKFIYHSPENIEWEILQAETAPFSEMWQARLKHLPERSALDYAKTHTYFGHYMAELSNNFLKKHHIKPDFIAAHGHTIFHYPEKKMTAQIGDAAALAALTGHTVICDFRTQDVALGGQGAPLAAIADKLLLNKYDFCLNLGGISNITANINNEKYVAFDISAANQVLNALANTIDMEYDKDGEIAAQGILNETLFDMANDNKYYTNLYPKSLDNQWVVKNVVPIFLEYDAPLADKLNTMCTHIVAQLFKSIAQIIKIEGLNKEKYTLIATGGGALNSYLMQCLKDYNHHHNIEIVLPDEKVIKFKEAALMALMGMLRYENVPNTIASVTGAKRATISGAVYI